MKIKMPDKWYEFCKKWKDDPRAKGYRKYILHADGNLERCHRIIKALQMDRRESLNILDISTGFGIFPYLCKCYGHNVTITDVVDGQNTICIEARKSLGLPRAIKFQYDEGRFKRLPEDIGTFNVITAFSVVPHSGWSMLCWGSFFVDAATHLSYPGIAVVRPNNSIGNKNLRSLLNTDELEGCSYVTKGRWFI
jgi:2-polyprenyl-3-methyl-5-hydroxy-6-metoxy-1,4-benzoquinol methylase